jgi:hypothetical protein
VNTPGDTEPDVRDVPAATLADHPRKSRNAGRVQVREKVPVALAIV